MPPLPPYPVLCYGANCRNPALFKIAACWSDGLTSELKTYGLACEACLPELYRDAIRRRQLCRLATGELLEQPRIYAYSRELRDRQLPTCQDLEQAILGKPTSS